MLPSSEAGSARPVWVDKSISPSATQRRAWVGCRRSSRDADRPDCAHGGRSRRNRCCPEAGNDYSQIPTGADALWLFHANGWRSPLAIFGASISHHDKNEGARDMSNTPFDRIWDQHVVREYGDGRALIHIDRHFAQEGTSGRAFDGLRERGLKVRRPELTVGTIDHGLSTLPGRKIDSYAASTVRNLAMRKNCAEFGVRLFDIDDRQSWHRACRRPAYRLRAAGLHLCLRRLATPPAAAASAHGPGASAPPRSCRCSPPRR